MRKQIPITTPKLYTSTCQSAVSSLVSFVLVGVETEICPLVGVETEICPLVGVETEICPLVGVETEICPLVGVEVEVTYIKIKNDNYIIIIYKHKLRA